MNVRPIVLASVVLLSAAAVAPSGAAVAYPVCVEVTPKVRTADCGGTVCVGDGWIPMVESCTFDIKDCAEWLVLCQPCTCPPLSKPFDPRGIERSLA